MPSAELKEIIIAKGHKNILAIHPTTLEFTKEDDMSRSGDCIIAVYADKAIPDLSVEFKEKLLEENARLTILIEAGGIAETVTAYGSAHLTLVHPTEIVVRKSNYICNRTLAVRADKASADLSRDLIEKLKNPAQKVKITLTVEA
ncbi:MAG TPA: DUF371 domain-containing protein [candidate division Zixibacteria bacterium]|nr:DUF371 domain-containing protein [candidate division Zixibacteria bacterium]